MPYQAPGSLTDQEYWEVTAYLVRANGADPIRVPLDEVRASQIRMNPARQILLTPTPEGSSKQPPEILIILAAGVGAIALLLAGFVGARALLRTQQK
jgi:hypothetical protein